jgi:hypothetical protein
VGFGELRVRVSDAFARVLPVKAFTSDVFGDMLKGLQVASQHRTFRVGAVTPFKVDFYRDSLGLNIQADGSHPEHLEVHENWPSWIAPFLEFQRGQTEAIESNTKVLSDFATQIKSHLDAIRGIANAADRLNEAINNLTLTIHREPNNQNYTG